MGWIAAAVAVVGGVIQSQSQKKQQKSAQKAEAAENQRASQWAAYREEQMRKWALQDQQQEANYKEDAVRSFAQFAPTQELRSMEGPERTQLDTSGLADFDPNDLNLNMTRRGQQPAKPVSNQPSGTRTSSGRALGQLA